MTDQPLNTGSPIAKAITLGLYILAAISPFIPALGKISKALIIFALLLLAIHVIEYFVFRKRLQEKAPNKNHFLPVLLYGVIYSMPLLKS